MRGAATPAGPGGLVVGPARQGRADRITVSIAAVPLPRPPLPPRVHGAIVTVGAALVLGAAAPAAAQTDPLAAVRQWVAAGQPERALAVARAAPEPRKPALRFAEGVILLDLARDVEAATVFEGLAQDFPELPEPHVNLATVHARAGRLEAARSALETALRNDPSHTLARLNLGEVYLALAVRAWEGAAAARPEDGALQRRLAQARELASRPR